MNRRCHQALASASAAALAMSLGADPSHGQRVDTSTAVEAACAKLQPANTLPRAAQHTAPVPALARPGKGEALLDPVHGSCVVRVTAHDQEPPKGFARNDYSRRQAFNADDTRLLVVAQDGYWHLYDARTLKHLKVLSGPAGDAEPQWHPTDPALLYYLPTNGVGMRLHELNVKTGHSRVVADFGTRLRALWPRAQSAWTRSEGSPSADGRYWAFQVDDDRWQGLGLFTYDLIEDKILATYDFAAHGKVRADHLSMSPSGRHVVVSWNDGPTAFTRELTQPRVLQRVGEHSDIALTADGDDAYVAIDYKANDGALFMLNLRTGQRTDLFPTYVAGTATALHVSGKAYRRPGWVLVSTYADYGKAGQQWLHRRLFAVELKAKPRIVHLAHHHSRYAKYWTEPHASANRDFTRLMFNSNWGTASETDVDAYMVLVPPGALAARP
ncbi:hypothetical protein M8A51_12450 [Schlegelella sp. S2-27]|uniref:Uncharacterized protein n=1 Tax=Caldimonas mangrovi TaxID=2944811 RepID=A0ABT0YNN4_9BURK|nr:hypothetical protein [Caldimonas mangrovi]MCM5680340.1 hypothetical protein [Caldimonas mangrovi]